MRRGFVLGCSVIAGLLCLSPGPIAHAGDVSGPDLTIYQEDIEQRHAAVAYNWRHDEYLVVWENVRLNGVHDIYARRVSGSGSLLTQFAISGGDGVSRTSPDVAYDSDEDRYLVIYTRKYSSTDRDIYGRFIPWAGPDAGLTEFAIGLSSLDETNPHVAYGLGGTVGRQYLVVWERGDSTPSVMGCLVDGDGTGPGTPWKISPAFSSHSPSLAYNVNRNEFLVVWEMDWTMTDLDIAAVILNASGSALYGGWFPVAMTSGDDLNPVAAACPSANQYLVAFEYPGPLDTEVRARLINGDGSMPDPIFDLNNDTSQDETAPSVSCLNKPGVYLVGWAEIIELEFGLRGVGSCTIGTDGAVSEPFWFGISYLGGNPSVSPDIAAGSADFLAAWQYGRDDGWPHLDLHACLVMPLILAANFEGGNTGEWTLSVQ